MCYLAGCYWGESISLDNKPDARVSKVAKDLECLRASEKRGSTIDWQQVLRISYEILYGVCKYSLSCAGGSSKTRKIGPNKALVGPPFYKETRANRGKWAFVCGQTAASGLGAGVSPAYSLPPHGNGSSTAWLARLVPFWNASSVVLEWGPGSGLLLGRVSAHAGSAFVYVGVLQRMSK